MNEIKLLTLDSNYPVNVRPAKRVKDLPENAMACLPLSIASQFGYELLINESFSVTWNGGPDVSDVVFRWETPPKHRRCAGSNGGNGFFSFMSNVIIRTPHGHNTYISGPPNLIKPGVQAMTAIVETDWNMAPFFMNYKLTEPNKEVTFNKNEPFCTFFAMPRYLEEHYELKIDSIISDNDEFNKHLKHEKSMTLSNGDRKGHYAKGEYHFGGGCPVNHQIKLNIK